MLRLPCAIKRVLCLSSLFSLISRHPTDLVWDRDNMHRVMHPFLLLPHDITEAPSVSQLASFADDHRSPLATPRSNTDVAARPLGGSAKCIHRLMMMMPMMPMPVVLPLSLSIARKDAHFDFTEPLAATRCNKFVSTGRSSSPQSPQSPQPMDEEERLKRPQFRGCCAASARVYKRCSPMCWLAASCNHLNFLVKPLPWWLFSPFWHIFYIFFIWMYHMAIDSIDP